MAKTEQMLRVKYIEDFLRRRKDTGASLAEIQSYLEQKFEEKDKAGDLKFTERTFLRDKKLINEISGIEISYSRAKNVYYIKKEELDIYEENIFDHLLLVEAYRETKSHRDIMFFEPRKSRGLEHLHGMIHAIKNKKIISFQYTSFWNGITTDRVVEPYALKEFEHRWYLLAKEHRTGFRNDDKNRIMKTFGLDRISNLEFAKSFIREEYDAEEAFKNSFGIIAPNGEEPQDIVLWFDAHQGNYIKSMPLHHSQQILEDGEEGLKIRLHLVPTYDFKQAVLSFGNRVKVLEPTDFQQEIKTEIAKMLKYYEE